MIDEQRQKQRQCDEYDLSHRICGRRLSLADVDFSRDGLRRRDLARRRSLALRLQLRRGRGSRHDDPVTAERAIEIHQCALVIAPCRGQLELRGKQASFRVENLQIVGIAVLVSRLRQFDAAR